MSEINPYSAPQSDAEPVGGLKRIPFTKEDEKNIASTATLMSVAAAASIVSGLLVLIASILAADYSKLVGNIIGAAATILMGVWIFSAAGSFKKVAQTDVADQQYLVEGFANLRRVFLLKAILIIVIITVIVVALFIGIVAAGAMSAR